MAADNTETLRQIAEKIDEIEELIQELYVNSAVKKNLVRELVAFQEDVEDNVDLTPTDWE